MLGHLQRDREKLCYISKFVMNYYHKVTKLSIIHVHKFIFLTGFYNEK